MRLRSLLLRWLLVPLAVLWMVGFRIQYVRSIDQVNEAYDRTLLGSALAMAERVSVRDAELSADVPYAALEMLDTRAQDRIFYRISSIADPRMSTGYADLPAPPVLPTADKPVFHDARYLD
jgi:two-component system sensor histidine kinase TctE